MNNLRLIHCLSYILLSSVLPAHSLPSSPTSTGDTSEYPLVCKQFLHVVLPYIGDADLDGDGASDYIGASIPATDLLEMPILDSLDDMALQYSINLLGDTVNYDVDSLILTCRDYANYAAEIFVEVHAWSQSSRIGTCSSLILATDGHGTCEIDELLIEIYVNAAPERPISDVQVVFEGDIDTTLQTDIHGSVSLYDYQWSAISITPSFDTEPLDGVTVTDMTLIHRHIIGMEALSNPYQLIAADVNNDGKVSTRDIVELQRMLIGIQQDFLNNSSWRFVCKDWDFEDPTNPWRQGPFPERKLLETFERRTLRYFRAIKIGDVSGEAPL